MRPALVFAGGGAAAAGRTTEPTRPGRAAAASGSSPGRRPRGCPPRRRSRRQGRRLRRRAPWADAVQAPSRRCGRCRPSSPRRSSAPPAAPRRGVTHRARAAQGAQPVPSTNVSPLLAYRCVGPSPLPRLRLRRRPLGTPAASTPAAKTSASLRLTAARYAGALPAGTPDYVRSANTAARQPPQTLGQHPERGWSSPPARQLRLPGRRIAAAGQSREGRVGEASRLRRRAQEKNRATGCAGRPHGATSTSGTTHGRPPADRPCPADWLRRRPGGSWRMAGSDGLTAKA